MAKKKGSKKKKGGKKAKKVEEVQISEKETLTERRNLLDRLVKNHTNLCEGLQKENDECRAKYETEVTHKDAITRHLRRTLDEEMAKCNQIREEMDEIIALHKPKKEKLAREIAALEDELNTMADLLMKDKLAVSGKLNLMGELRLQKDGLLGKLRETEEKVRKNAIEYKERLRDLDCEQMFHRENFEKGMRQKLSKTIQRFEKGANANLTYAIKQALKESLHTSEQLRRKADLGLELQNENLKLRDQEMFLKLQVDLEMSRDSQLSSKILKQDIMIEDLLQEWSKAHEERFPSTGSLKMDSIMEKSDDLQKEFLRVYFKSRQMEAEKKQQEKFIDPLKDSVNRLRKSNAHLLSVVRRAEQVFRSEVMEKFVEEKDSSFEARSARNDLLKQFVDILHTGTTISRYRDGLEINKSVLTDATDGKVTDSNKTLLSEDHYISF